MIVVNPYVAASVRYCWQCGYDGKLLTVFESPQQKQAYMEGRALRATHNMQQPKDQRK